MHSCTACTPYEYIYVYCTRKRQHCLFGLTAKSYRNTYCCNNIMGLVSCLDHNLEDILLDLATHVFFLLLLLFRSFGAIPRRSVLTCYYTNQMSRGRVLSIKYIKIILGQTSHLHYNTNNVVGIRGNTGTLSPSGLAEKNTFPPRSFTRWEYPTRIRVHLCIYLFY